MEMCFIHLHSLIKRINIYVNIYSLNQTIVSHSFVSFKPVFTRVHTEFLQNVWSWKFGFKSWENHWSTTSVWTLSCGSWVELLGRERVGSESESESYILTRLLCIDDNWRAGKTFFLSLLLVCSRHRPVSPSPDIQRKLSTGSSRTWTSISAWPDDVAHMRQEEVEDYGWSTRGRTGRGCITAVSFSQSQKHYITLHHVSFSRRFYPKRLSAFNLEYKLRTTRIQKVTFPQHSRTTKVPQ